METFARSATVLFFVRWPEPGRVKSRLAAAVGAEQACRMHRALAEVCFANALAACDQGLVVCGTGASEGSFRAWLPGAADYWQQPDGDLGQRLEHLMARAFGQGATRVAVMGSDAPSLTAEAIRDALAALDHAQGVLLPAHDGGYVLLALRHHVPQLFRGIDWGTEGVCEATRAAADRAGVPLHLGATFRDVDTFDDWTLLMSSATPHPQLPL